jgi:chromosome segregation ATPase
VSPVQKVIELLDELKGKLQADLSAEETMMGEYTKWCDEEANQKEDAITSAKRTIGDLEASIQDSAAQIQALSAEADELTTKISKAEADLESATYIRDDERSTFEGSEKELVETVDTLSRALVVLKRGQAFMQSKAQNADLQKLADGLSKVVAASWVTAKQKSVVQSLVQADDEDLSLQPQATAAAYSSQGGGILDTLGDLKAKAEDSLSTQRKTEMEASHKYEMLKQSLDTELANMKDRLQTVANERSGEEESKASAAEELAETQKSLAADESYLASLNQDCAAKAKEWAARQKQAGEEQAAIEKAKEVLADGVKVFLQVSKRDSKAQNAKIDQVSTLVRALAAKAGHSYALNQLAAEVSSDTFGKVKGLIEDMIDRLTKEAAEEADAKAFCDTEVSKSRAKQQKLSDSLDMHSVRIEKAAAGQAKLKEQIQALQAEVAEIDASQKEATALRQEEKAAFTKASAEYAQSAEAVANAIQVLQSYYSSGSFVQVKSKQAPEFGGAQSDVGSTIVSMLEVAESDFSRLLAESTAAENAAQAAYDDLSQKNKVSRAAKMEEAKGKEGEVKALEMSLTNYKEDHASTAKELDAVLEYLDKLKPQCETKVMSYAERKSRREAEIAGLKEALGILEG